MGYSDTELRNAYLADEVARLQNENHGLFAFANSNRPSYGIVPDPEPTLADLTDDDIDGAITELAAQRGISVTELGEALLSLTGGLRDSYSRSLAVAELTAMDEDEAGALLGLAATGTKPKGKPFGLDDDEDAEDAEDEDEDDEEDEDETAPPKARKKRSRKPPRKFRRGQRVAAEGGEPSGGAGPAGEGAGGAMAATAGPRRRLVRAGYGYETVALSEDQEWAEAEADRLIALAASRNAPSAFEVSPGTTGNVEEHFDFQVYDVGAEDDGDPSDPDGGNTNAIIARLQKEHPGMFGKDKTYGANTRHAPKSVAARNAAERRESTKPQNPIER